MSGDVMSQQQYKVICFVFAGIKQLTSTSRFIFGAFVILVLFKIGFLTYVRIVMYL